MLCKRVARSMFVAVLGLSVAAVPIYAQSAVEPDTVVLAQDTTGNLTPFQERRQEREQAIAQQRAEHQAKVEAERQKKEQELAQRKADRQAALEQRQAQNPHARRGKHHRGQPPSPKPTSAPTATPQQNQVISITSPADGATVSGAVNIVTTFQSPPIVWENIHVDGNYLASSPPNTFSWDSTKVSNGSHVIDAQGMSANDTIVNTAEVHVDVENQPKPTPAPQPSVAPQPAPQPKPQPSNQGNSNPPQGSNPTPAPGNNGNNGNNGGGFQQGVTPGATIPQITGDPSGLGGDTNDADYGNYNAPGGQSPDGVGLIGGPLLDDMTAATHVVATPQSSVETNNSACNDSTSQDCSGYSTIAEANAHDNDYFNSIASNNPSDYVNQVQAFTSEWNDAWAQRIDGACPIANPTTAEALQWAANKWGINPLLMYAEATEEGDWDNTTLGDVHDGIGTSSGVLQVADTNTSSAPEHAWQGFSGAGHRLSRENTCFNADFYAARLWAAFNGITGECPQGDIGACVESWMYGHVSSAGSYAKLVFGHLSSRDWEQQYFNGQQVPY
jgi:hypothetical protein